MSTSQSAIDNSFAKTIVGIFSTNHAQKSKDALLIAGQSTLPPCLPPFFSQTRIRKHLNMLLNSVRLFTTKSIILPLTYYVQMKCRDRRRLADSCFSAGHHQNEKDNNHDQFTVMTEEIGPYWFFNNIKDFCCRIIWRLILIFEAATFPNSVASRS